MPPKTPKTGGNKKSEGRKATSRCHCKGCGTSNGPTDAMTSEVEETETISKPAKADAMLRMENESSRAIKPKKVHSTPVKADTSHQGHRGQLYPNEETRVAAETLELLQGTYNPNESPPEEEAYFGGSGLITSTTPRGGRKDSNPTRLCNK